MSKAVAGFLRLLADDEAVVLHGSPSYITEGVLEPRRPDGFWGYTPEGRVGVHATSHLEIAIVHALIQRTTPLGWWRSLEATTYWWSRRLHNQRLKVVGDLQLGAGYVYILPRDTFERIKLFDYVSEESVPWNLAIEVTPDILTHFPEIQLQYV